MAPNASRTERAAFRRELRDLGFSAEEIRDEEDRVQQTGSTAIIVERAMPRTLPQGDYHAVVRERGPGYAAAKEADEQRARYAAQEMARGVAKALIDAGLELQSTGGGNMAWRLHLSNRADLLITGDDAVTVGVDPREKVWGFALCTALDEHSDPEKYSIGDYSLSEALRAAADALENTEWASPHEGRLRGAATEVWQATGEAAAEGEVVEGTTECEGCEQVRDEVLLCVSRDPGKPERLVRLCPECRTPGEIPTEGREIIVLPEWACPVHGFEELNLCERTVMYVRIDASRVNEEGKIVLGEQKVDDEGSDSCYIECLAGVIGERGQLGICSHRYEMEGTRFEGEAWPFEWGGY